MNTIMAAWPAFATVFFATTAVAAVILLQRNRSRQRTSDLNAAASALQAHYEALEQFLSDPAAPKGLKDLLTSFSEALSDREVARKVATAFRDGELFSRPPEAVSWKGDLDRLKRTRPDLVDMGARVIGTGIVVMFLRWPETSAIFQQMMAELASDSRREFVIARTVAKRSANDRSNGNGPLLPGQAVPA